nr:MAG TPA: hypothetical protein [Caudoviricetes sp.]
MSRAVEVLALLLALGYRWLEKLDADRAQAFRDSLRDDPLRVLMQQTGGKPSDPVHAHSDKSKDRGAGRGEGVVDR